ncbi:MAG: glycosyltransferase family 4 protein [Chloroflexi bacterium]|nr:glycosyltransferase family 4 protein [Chloroflexota bacterium]
MAGHSERELNVAIVVHGRWDAFDLARELDRRGVNVRLLTNYPSQVVSRFGVRRDMVRGFWPHGVLARAVARAGSARLAARCEPVLHSLFGRWAAATLRKERWDVVYAFSGVAEEAFSRLQRAGPLRVLVRESSHIRTQERLLCEEELRTGIPQERPSVWRIAREEREYALADVIRVLSSFSYQTFVDEGVRGDKLRLVLSGADLGRFRPSAEVVHARVARILSGEPLRVLNVGTFALRKGVWDSAAVIDALGDEFQFRFVGPVAPEVAPIAARLQERGVEFWPKQAEASLPAAYAWADLFMLPTIEDGFQAVLAQAAASGLPILTTPNGAGRDLVRDGNNGWVLPVRCPDVFALQLRWADCHRQEFAEMVQATYAHFQPRDFATVAADLENMFCDALARRA